MRPIRLVCRFGLCILSLSITREIKRSLAPTRAMSCANIPGLSGDDLRYLHRYGPSRASRLSTNLVNDELSRTEPTKLGYSGVMVNGGSPQRRKRLF
ncbi:hypothetical protein F4781DRAFT_413579 [Annulohypoxylon bovei var. microspora]|nr:hypothetical protein F4781DRAFT_413579 [Annulohypoxylon bovei var. microspora]